MRQVPRDVVHDNQTRAGARALYAGVLAWAACSLTWAHARVPFDDEWFSLELALHTSNEQFWRALDHDVHPPWLALLDRAVGSLWPHPLAFQSLRVLAVALALGLLAQTFSRRIRLPGWAFPLAALHPIVMFYAGSVRWYPLLLLAHALRLRALGSARPLAPPAAVSFVAGSLLGSLSSYLDPLFVVHDAAWLAVRARAAENRPRPWARASLIIAAAIGCSVLLRVFSPLSEPLHRAWPGLPSWDWRALGQFVALGLAGEAALPSPWTLTGLCALLACAWGLAASWRDRETRAIACWLMSYGLAWLVAVGFGAWHPRYALLLWLGYALLVLKLARGRARLVAAAGLAHWLLVLGLMLHGRSYFKATLNRWTPDDCAVLAQVPPTDRLVITYPGLTEQLVQDCAERRPLVVIPSIRLVEPESEQLAHLAAQLPAASVVWQLSLNTQSSLIVSDERVSRLLASRCAPEPARAFGVAPHAALKSQSDSTRFHLRRWQCTTPDATRMPAR